MSPAIQAHVSMVPLLCDLDDTLIDRAGAFSDWTVQFAARNSLGMDAVEFLRELDRDGQGHSRPRGEYFEIVRDALGLTPGPEELTNEYLDEIAGLARPARGVRPIMRQAGQEGWQVAVVTNGDYRQRVKLAVARLEPLVTAIVVSAEVGLAKPNPEIFRYAAAQLDGDVARAWVVGDHPVNDIRAGHDAGMHTAWVSLGRPWAGPGVDPLIISNTAAGAIGAVLGTAEQQPAKNNRS